MVTEKDRWFDSLDDYKDQIDESSDDAKKIMTTILRYKKRVKNRGSAIRAKCIECMGGIKEVQDCVSCDCPLWLFRLGKDAFRNGTTSPPVKKEPKNPKVKKRSPKPKKKPVAKKKATKKGINPGLLAMQEANRRRREEKAKNGG